jgi:hypothetical protein
VTAITSRLLGRHRATGQVFTVGGIGSFVLDEGPARLGVRQAVDECSGFFPSRQQAGGAEFF